MIELIWPWAFAILLLPLVVRFLIPARTAREAALNVPHVDAFVFSQQEIGSGSNHRSIFLFIIACLAWLSLATALSRPQWTGEPTLLPTLSRDLVLAIDISGSMGQGDMSVSGRQYTRLAVVKHAVQDFVEKRDGDRIGIVLFGSVPYVYVPLTPDVSTASQMLTDAPIGIAGRSTAIGDSLGLAIKQILNHPADHRVVVLMTDGVNNFGELEPMDAAELAAASDVTVYTIGIVPPESSLGFFAPFQRRTDAVDEELLKEIAAKTGGKYYKADDLNGLLAIYEDIDALEPIENEGQTVRPRRALYHYPLGLALALFALAWLLYSRRNV
ncbi:MAG: VWA domain-containing protein [Gammaproteobacteria bacterium]|nr:VWA domain-containing protein [Gammaproteobacteria bacterium]